MKHYVLAGSIVLGSLILATTLILLNVRHTYSMLDSRTADAYVRLMTSGCTEITANGYAYALSCPLWITL